MSADGRPFGSLLSFDWSVWSVHLGLPARIQRTRISTACGCGRADCYATRRELSSRPTDRHKTTLAEPACVHLAWCADTTHLPGTDLPLHSSAGPDPPSTAANISTVAGRLAPSAERPAHPQGIVSPNLSAKRPSRPVVCRLAAGPSVPASRSRSARGSAVRYEPDIPASLRQNSKFQTIRLTGFSSVLL